MPEKPTAPQIMNLRSRAWFDNPANVDMTALYLERTINYGLTLDELQSGLREPDDSPAGLELLERQPFVRGRRDEKPDHSDIREVRDRYAGSDDNAPGNRRL